ncbi:MAG: 5'-nucleotidase C-terminal domain-containing protein [Bacillota bacterium]|nr:5'-nucleotidase C-terminal domain-containing protein [Bacillota bacterium]
MKTRMMKHEFMRRRTALARGMALLLCLVLPFTFLGGCAQTGTQASGDDQALTIWIPTAVNSFENLTDLLRESHPDITFEKSGYAGSSSSALIDQRFENGDLTDIVVATVLPPDEIQEECMLDLSGYDFVQNYRASVLNNLDVNGKIYFLEGPSSFRCIAYNKTLFAEMGWEAPTSHEEFIALVRQIHEESDIMPLALPGKYSGTYFTLMTELSHCDFLQTPEGAAWAEAFAAGEASTAEGFGTGISLLQDWVDAGVFDESQITAGDSADYTMFANRECAMVYVMGNKPLLLELTDASGDEFGSFPIYGYGENSDFCAVGYGAKIGLNKSLGEPGNEKKLENALKLLELFSTIEGQMTAYAGVGDVLTLAGSSSELPPLFDGIKATIEKGHTAPFLYTGYTDIMVDAGEYMRDVCVSGGDLSGVFEIMDELRRTSLENTEEIYLATVEETLDERQTAQFVANALDAQGLGDFALVSMGKYSKHFYEGGGSNGKMYAGGITSERILIPLSGYNLQNIVTLSLTGARVRELLEQGRILHDDEGNTISFEYFASGIEVTRGEDGGVESVSLNGAPLEEDTVYTVAFCPQDYTDELAAEGNLQDTGVVWMEVYRDYVTGLGTITPADAE